MEEFFNEALGLIEKRTDEIFKSRGSTNEKSDKWRDLAPSTKKARERRWGYYKKEPKNPTTLRWTGNLQDNRTKTIERTRAIYQHNAPYAIYHQTGGGKLPQRAIIDLDNGTNREIVRALQAKIERDIGVFGTQV